MKRQTQPVDSTAAMGQDRDIGSRPVETTEHAAVTQATQVKIPRSQAFWVALSFTVAVMFTLASPIALGARIFWAATGIAALAAFLWSVQFELHWQDRVTLPLLVGLLMWCFWRFTDWLGWRVPDSWQPLPAFLSIASMTFWWIFTLALWLTFGQRLALPIYHQQYSVWDAIRAIWVYRGTREQPEPPPPTDPEREPIPFTFISENGRVRHNVETPFDRQTMQWIARVLQEETLSEASMCGPDSPLAGGQNGREALAELREWLIAYGLMRWNRVNGNGEPIMTQGVSLTRNGLRWVEEVGR